MRPLVSSALAVSLLGSWVVSARAQEPAPRRLIEFGWDEPDTGFLRRHRVVMERTPFDGCVFHANSIEPDGTPGNFTWLCWGRRAFTEDAMRGAFDDLRALAATPSRFRHNFLRFNVTPGDVDWFDDFGPILANARLAARLARAGPCDGILFDVEQYEKPLFHYLKQRDAATKSWDDYAAQARRRGREVMTAFQEGFPGLTVLLTFGHTLPWTQTQRRSAHLNQVEYALLAPFLDGMIEAVEGDSRLVDGFELSYGYRNPTQFATAARMMREDVLAIVAAPERYRRIVSAGFGIWMDFDWRRHGWNEDDPARNYFTPEAFETSIRAALEHADHYVWIYTETPRWWTETGGRAKLPDAYDQALRRARSPITTPAPKPAP